jgi:hypothetical protein
MRNHPSLIATLSVFVTLFTLGCGGGGGEGEASAGGEETGPEETGEDADISDPEDTTEDEDTVDIDPKCGITPGFTCNPICHTGCDEGQACLFTDGVFSCMPAGFGAHGSACSTLTDCASGTCVESPTGQATCASACLDATDCPTNIDCDTNVTGATIYKFCGVEAGVCTLLETGVCPEGEICYPVGSGVQCLTPGTLGANEPCNGPSDCLPDHDCINFSGAANPVCVKLCSLKGSKSGTPIGCDTMCGVGNFYPDDDKLKLLKVGYCNPDIEINNCNPLTQSCGAGQGCYSTSDGWVCISAGNKEAGQTCSDPSDCSKGLFCLGNKCKVICNPGQTTNNPECSSFDVSCVSFNGAGYCDE